MFIDLISINYLLNFLILSTIFQTFLPFFSELVETVDLAHILHLTGKKPSYIELYDFPRAIGNPPEYLKNKNKAEGSPLFKYVVFSLTM